VIDHFGFESQLGGEDHAAVLADSVVQSAAVLPGGLQGPVLFRGIALSVPADSETVSRMQAVLLVASCIVFQFRGANVPWQTTQ
jgi:hypothetical protein